MDETDFDDPLRMIPHRPASTVALTPEYQSAVMGFGEALYLT